MDAVDKLDARLARDRRRAAKKALRRISREELPVHHRFAIIATVALVVAPFTLGVGGLLILAGGAIYMAVKMMDPAARLAEAERAHARTYLLYREYPEVRKVEKFVVARGKLVAAFRRRQLEKEEAKRGRI